VALAARRQALDLYERLGDEFPDVVEYQRGAVHIGARLGLLLMAAGKAQAAEAAHRRAVEVANRALRRWPGSQPLKSEKALALCDLGGHLFYTNRWPEAECAAGESLQLFEELTVTSPSLDITEKLAWALRLNGALLSRDHRVRVAQQFYCRSIGLWVQMAGGFPNHRRYPHEAVTASTLLANMVEEPADRDRLAEAAADLLRLRPLTPPIRVAVVSLLSRYVSLSAQDPSLTPAGVQAIRDATRDRVAELLEPFFDVWKLLFGIGFDSSFRSGKPVATEPHRASILSR
jgi:tetratricopeptide (TPR) repeat protein